MAANTPPPLAPATLIRLVAGLDIALGVAMALFGETVIPLGEFAAGLRLWWLVGGFLALGGVGAFVFAATLDRQRRAAAPASDDPVRRD